MSEPIALPLALEAAVRQRYGEAARSREWARCCPAAAAIPAEGRYVRGAPRETKGGDCHLTTEAGPICKLGACC